MKPPQRDAELQTLKELTEEHTEDGAAARSESIGGLGTTDFTGSGCARIRPPDEGEETAGKERRDVVVCADLHDIHCRAAYDRKRSPPDAEQRMLTVHVQLRFLSGVVRVLATQTSPYGVPRPYPACPVLRSAA